MPQQDLIIEETKRVKSNEYILNRWLKQLGFKSYASTRSYN